MQDVPAHRLACRKGRGDRRPRRWIPHERPRQSFPKADGCPKAEVREVKVSQSCRAAEPARPPTHQPARPLVRRTVGTLAGMEPLPRIGVAVRHRVATAGGVRLRSEEGLAGAGDRGRPHRKERLRSEMLRVGTGRRGGEALSREVVGREVGSWQDLSAFKRHQQSVIFASQGRKKKGKGSYC